MFQLTPSMDRPVASASSRTVTSGMARTMARMLSALWGERVVAGRGKEVVFLVVFFVVFLVVPAEASPLAVRAEESD